MKRVKIDDASTYEGIVMPIEAVAVLVGIGLVFAVFAAGVLYADYQTREFRD